LSDGKLLYVHIPSSAWAMEDARMRAAIAGDAFKIDSFRDFVAGF